MALIRLTALLHPDYQDQQRTVYIDASRVLVIAPEIHQVVKKGSLQKKRVLYEILHENVAALQEKMQLFTNRKAEIEDTPSVNWIRDAHALAHAVSNAQAAWAQSYNAVDDFHPEVQATCISMACGSALEHGVMLTRVWVTETPEQVHQAMWEVGQP